MMDDQASDRSESLPETLSEIQGSFETNIGGVIELMNFDRVVLEFAMTTVEALHNRLRQTSAGDRPWLNAENTIAALRRVRENDSLRPRYQTIFNQCDVLLVSYFAAATQDIFKVCLPERLRQSSDQKFLKQKMEVTFADLKEADLDLLDRFAELFIDSKDLSFQDMGSIARAFGEFIGYDPPRGPHVNNIIAAQACRHVIVHAGGAADRRLERQLREASPREVKPSIVEGDQIRFTTSEVEQVAESMRAYVDDLVQNLEGIFADISGDSSGR